MNIKGGGFGGVPQMSQARNWNFTLNNFNEDDLENFSRLSEQINENSDITYLIIGREIGVQGTPHLQGFIQFRTKKRMNQVKSLFSFGNGRFGHLSTMHRRSSPLFCSQYCKKDGDFEEWGVIQTTMGKTSERFYRIILAQ